METNTSNSNSNNIVLAGLLKSLENSERIGKAIVCFSEISDDEKLSNNNKD